MQRIQLELRACKDKLAEIPQDFFDNLIFELNNFVIFAIINAANSKVNIRSIFISFQSRSLPFLLNWIICITLNIFVNTQYFRITLNSVKTQLHTFLHIFHK